MAKPLLILGTSSHVGKSIITAGICRILAEQEYKVAPFKAQNMSLNSWITREGDEIGIAQAVQAHAAGIEPTSDMNPVLLKPKGDKTSQVILLGKPYADKSAGEYYDSIPEMMELVTRAYHRLSKQHDFIIMEGAGGAAEINLYERDIVNIGIARALKPPIILVGDIERGGVFASIYGTIQLLPEDIRPLVKGIIINKFRGDATLLQPGIKMLEELTSIPVIGVLPHTKLNIPSEDSVSIKDKQTQQEHSITIAVIRLNHISNFTDFEPLEKHANISYVEPHEDIGNPDAIILPGTKNTIDDLKELQYYKMDKQIQEHAEKGTPIIGICGGYQMLGKTITDKAIESTSKTSATINALGLIDAHTTFEGYHKHTKQTTKTISAKGPIFEAIKGQTIKGYEIHMGTTSHKEQTAFTDDGCTNHTGLIIGTYLHGLFENTSITNALLKYLNEKKNQPHTPIKPAEDPYTNLSNLLTENLQLNKIYHLLGI